MHGRSDGHHPITASRTAHCASFALASSKPRRTVRRLAKAPSLRPWAMRTTMQTRLEYHDAKSGYVVPIDKFMRKKMQKYTDERVPTYDTAYGNRVNSDYDGKN